MQRITQQLASTRIVRRSLFLLQFPSSVLQTPTYPHKPSARQEEKDETHTDICRIAFIRARAAGSMSNTIVFNDTCWNCLSTSIPKQTMTTAAMFTPPAPVWMAWKTMSPSVATTAAAQGRRRSMARPTSGATQMPRTPTRPKRPITMLCGCEKSGGRMGESDVR